VGTLVLWKGNLVLQIIPKFLWTGSNSEQLSIVEFLKINMIHQKVERPLFVWEYDSSV